MGEHFITVCKECKEIITQCRCMVLDKAITYDVCDECKSKKDCKHNWVSKNTGVKVLGADSYVCTKCPAVMDRQQDFYDSKEVQDWMNAPMGKSQLEKTEDVMGSDFPGLNDCNCGCQNEPKEKVEMRKDLFDLYVENEISGGNWTSSLFTQDSLKIAVVDRLYNLGYRKVK